MTADGVCVCTHDASVELEGAPRRVCDLTASQLALIAGQIPTLEEALTSLRGRIAVAEIKNHPWDACYDASHAVTEMVALALPDDAVVACFDPATLSAACAVRPQLRTAVITGAAFDPDANLDAAIAGGHQICSVEHSAIMPSFVERAHHLGKQVYAWATDEPDEVRRLRDAGVDALMCDDPARAIAALER